MAALAAVPATTPRASGATTLENSDLYQTIQRQFDSTNSKYGGRYTFFSIAMLYRPWRRRWDTNISCPWYKHAQTLRLVMAPETFLTVDGGQVRECTWLEFIKNHLNGDWELSSLHDNAHFRHVLVEPHSDKLKLSTGQLIPTWASLCAPAGGHAVVTLPEKSPAWRTLRDHHFYTNDHVSASTEDKPPDSFLFIDGVRHKRNPDTPLGTPMFKLEGDNVDFSSYVRSNGAAAASAPAPNALALPYVFAQLSAGSGVETMYTRWSGYQVQRPAVGKGILRYRGQGDSFARSATMCTQGDGVVRRSGLRHGA